MRLNNPIYNPVFLFKSKHFNTMYRTLFQDFELEYSRKRLELKDGDFLDLDFSIVNSKKVTIIIHGLEGSSNSTYVKSLVINLNKNTHDAIVINLRGCGGEINRLISSYHSGKTDDLAEVINYLSSYYTYDEINLVGFSLGGNIILKYLGEQVYTIPSKIASAVTISVPCDLKGSSIELSKFWNAIYMRRFLLSLKQKLQLKIKQFPNSFIDIEKIEKSTNFFDFDDLYTAPAHGFKDAFDYWEKNSSKQFIPNIKVPTLLITSSDDPFLSPSCIPFIEAKNNTNFHLENTKYGGHVGFNSNFSMTTNNWLEKKIVQFLNKI